MEEKICTLAGEGCASCRVPFPLPAYQDEGRPRGRCPFAARQDGPLAAYMETDEADFDARCRRFVEESRARGIELG